MFLLVKAVGPDPTADGLLARDFAMLGTAVLCGLALRGVDVVDRVWRTSTLVVTALLAGCAVMSLIPAEALAAPTRSAIDVGAGVVTGTIGLALVLCGLCSTQLVLRPTGLALLMLSAQQSPVGSALGLAGVAMLLVTAVPFVVRALRAMWSEQAESQSRIHAAEQAIAVTAVREHEMRNLVAGLCGAVNVLTTGERADHSQLGAAARTELERLRRILASDQRVGGQVLTQVQPGPSSVAVGPILSDLAALHSAPDSAIEVTVTGEPHAVVAPDCLAHVVTNLLVNCARHAPGAHVWMTACRRGEHIVIEVTDDGPGLPPGLPAELLRPGTRGPSSTGTGLGLSVSADLLGRYGGHIRLVPTITGGGGCTALVELPAATTRSLDTVAV